MVSANLINTQSLEQQNKIWVKKTTNTKELENTIKSSKISIKIVADNTKKSLEADKKKIEKIAEILDSYVQSTQHDLKIQIHDKTGDIMVKVISGEDGKVIREIPPEALLNLAAKVEEMMGALVNENA